jgi:hypothetical protein
MSPDHKTSLAAVDMHTARHLFNHCLNPRAKLTHGRTIILVTHHVSLCLPAASYLVELGGGQVIKQGPVEELRKSGILDVVEEDDPSVTPREDPPSSVADDSSETVDGDENEVSFGSGTLVDEETRAEGRVSVRTYLLYIRSAGWLSWVLTFLLLVGCTPLYIEAPLKPFRYLYAQLGLQNNYTSPNGRTLTGKQRTGWTTS